MAKITVITLVHNPGEFIYPCVESVLGQTFQDFEYVIMDNASTDGTKEVLEDYAKRDSRIRLYRNEENNENALKVIEKYVDTEYVMVLDHDDYLMPCALERLYNVAQKEDLDVVFGRSMMVNERGESLAEAGMKLDIPCFDEEQLSMCFAHLYWQMRTLWGKLIRRKMMKYVDTETIKKRAPSAYAWDTVIVLSITFAAERIGTVGEILHHYRILSKSDCRTYRRQQFLADWVLLDMGRRLLRERNMLTTQNELFLLEVYYNAILDTIRLAVNSDKADQEKIEVISEIVTKEHTKEMKEVFQRYDEEKYIGFLKCYGREIVNLYLRNVNEEKCRDLMYQWLELLYGEKYIRDDFSYLYDDAKKLLLLLSFGQAEETYKEIRNNELYIYCPSLYLELALEIEKDIVQMAQVLLQVGSIKTELFQRASNAIDILIEQNVLLNGAVREDLKANPDIVTRVCMGDYENAMNLCIERLNKREWQRSGGVLEVAISLSALLECAELFIAFKKCSCEFLCQEGKKEEAIAVLEDLYEMCPGDEDVATLAEAIRGK